MDTYKLVSVFRSLPELRSESDISTPELINALSRAHRKVMEALPKKFDNALKFTKLYASLSTNPTFMAGAKDVIRVWRRTAGASPVYRSAARLPGILEHIVDESPQFEATESYPYYILDGWSINIYPALSNTNVQVEYLREIPDLLMGVGALAYGGSADGWKIQLDTIAFGMDDFYNHYFLALYKKDSDGAYNHLANFEITDYAYTRLATLNVGTPLPSGWLTNGDYLYALVPLVPEDYDHMIVDLTFVELVKMDKLTADAATLEASVFNQIKMLFGGEGN